MNYEKEKENVEKSIARLTKIENAGWLCNKYY